MNKFHTLAAIGWFVSFICFTIAALLYLVDGQWLHAGLDWALAIASFANSRIDILYKFHNQKRKGDIE